MYKCFHTVMTVGKNVSVQSRFVRETRRGTHCIQLIFCYTKFMDDIQVTLASMPDPIPPQPPRPGFDKSKLILPGAILLAAIMVSGSILYARLNAGQALIQNAGNPDEPQYVTVGTDDDPVLGNPDAPVTMIEFSDFQCPYCRSFWRDTLPQIKSQYIDTGKVKLVYRDFPLSIHAQAMLGAEAANCANAQGKYWQMHDEIFKQQDKQGAGTITFTQQDTEKWAANIGLNVAQFRSCVSANTYADEINHDTNDGDSISVSGTPTFVINGLKIVGAQPFSVFKAAIDAALK